MQNQIWTVLTVVSLSCSMVMTTKADEVDVTFSEANLMYHFPDLHDQFSYNNYKHLSHKGRIANTVRMLNEIEADVTCLMEWNGNSLNPYHLDEPKKLVEKLNALIDSVIGKSSKKEEALKFLNSLKGETAKVQDYNYENAQKLIEDKINNQNKEARFDDELLANLQEMFDRMETIRHAKDLYFLRDSSKWLLKIVQKKSGTVVINGAPTGNTYKEPAPKTSTSPMQSILMIIRKEKFDNLDDKFNVYTDAPEDEKSPNSQNFVTKRLTTKHKKINFEVICTHMKSKYAIFPTRRKLARTISAYVEKTKSAEGGKNVNFVLMGDMNSEIPEFAHDLNANILRFKTNRPLPSEKFEPETVYTPLSQIPDIQKRIAEDDKTNKEFESYKSKGACAPSKFKSEKAAFDAMILETNAIKDGVESLPLWIETANFPTEKKIRVGEIDYSETKYQEYLGQYLAANKAVENLVKDAEIAYDATIAATRKKEFEKLKEDKNECKERIPEFKEAEKDARNKKAEAFRAITQDLWKRMEAKGVEKNLLDSIDKVLEKYKAFAASKDRKWGPEDNSPELYYFAFLSSLIFDEKIDFILLLPYNNFKMLQTKSVSTYEKDLILGIPNKQFPTDHFPTWVKIKFFEAVYDQKSFIASLKLNPIYKCLPPPEKNGGGKRRTLAVVKI